MKSNLAAKIIAWILLVIVAFTFFISLAGISVLLSTGAYWDGGRIFRESVSEEVFGFDKVRIYYILREYMHDDDIDDAEYREMYKPENSNVFFVITNSEGKVVVDYGSNEEYQLKYEYTEYYKSPQHEMTETLSFATEAEAGAYIEELEKEYLVDWYVVNPKKDKTGFDLEVTYYNHKDVEFTVSAYIREVLSAEDRYYYSLQAVNFIVAMRYWIILLSVVSAVFCLLIMIFLCSSAGHRAGKEVIHLSFLHRIPLDAYIAFCALCGIASVLLMKELSEVKDMAWFTVVVFVLVFPICTLLIASAIVTLAARIKAGVWWKNTVICRAAIVLKRFAVWFFLGCVHILKNIPLFWKALALFLLIKIAEAIFLVYSAEAFFIFWAVESVLFLCAIIYIVFMLVKLQKAAEEIAKGDLDYRADLSHMPHTLREHGENLNNIGQGLKSALEEQVKSEHMKAELITNVSHDIKTPLTSIVNYVGILKKVGLSSPSAPEYLDVLERQSVKLKKLTEDLIEASKATSGCVKVEAEEMDLNVLLSQACGEYESRFMERDLCPILNLDEKCPIIFADGRLLWRVFDNLFNNICKYSQEGTRVYLKTEVRETKVAVIFSNISKAQLDISGNELVERFVRGDSSRNTEGSGLGLSIARSLTELQGGEFAINIDGDLFKIEIIFDLF